MKILKGVLYFYGLSIVAMDIFFGFFWKEGFYYFRYVLLYFSIAYLIFWTMDTFLIYSNEKHKNLILKGKGDGKKKLRKRIMLPRYDRKNRDFSYVFYKICELLPKKEAISICEESIYWAPEALWENLATYVNNNVVPNSEDVIAIRIYAILCGKTDRYMRKKIQKSGKMKRR